MCRFDAPKRKGIFSSDQNSKKCAFTLAEVLITLGIIGIIAALTIPGVIEGYKKKETVAKLQKAYTLLNQALRLSEAKYEEYEYWESGYSMGDAEVYLKKYWAPHFKVLTYCHIPKDCGYDSNRPYKYLKGTKTTYDFSIQDRRVPFSTADGIVYTVSIAGGDLYTEDNSIVVDLNGYKQPNQFGKDVFFFRRVKKKGILPNGYQLTPEDISQECSLNGDGYYCAAKIMNDGWEIKDDYPW